MLPPRSGNAPQLLVVLLHGYGADGQDLLALGQAWRSLLPDAAFIAPNAPERCADNPAGYQWFPLDLGRTIRSVAGVPAAAAPIAGFLQELWEQTGLDAGRTVLAGFSQGAMMALHVGLALPEPPLGIIAFSGALVPPESSGAATERHPPVALIHGALDQVVDPELSRIAAETLQAQGVDVSYHSSPGTAHGISPDGFEFATQFLLARAAAAPK